MFEHAMNRININVLMFEAFRDVIVETGGDGTEGLEVK